MHRLPRYCLPWLLSEIIPLPHTPSLLTLVLAWVRGETGRSSRRKPGSSYVDKNVLEILVFGILGVIRLMWLSSPSLSVQGLDLDRHLQQGVWASDWVWFRASSVLLPKGEMRATGQVGGAGASRFESKVKHAAE